MTVHQPSSTTRARGLDRRRVTVAEAMVVAGTIDEDERVELIGGKLVSMSAKGGRHDSSLRYDTGRKAAVHASFGVREPWVIDAVASKIHIFGDPTAAGSTRTVAASATATPLIAPSAFSLRLADVDL